MIKLNDKTKYAYTLKGISKEIKEVKSIEDELTFRITKPFNSGNTYKLFRDKFSTIKFNINVDLNSLLALVEPKDYVGLLNAVFYSYLFITDIPYSLKTNKKKPLAFNFLVNMNKYSKYVNEALTFVNADHFARKLQWMPANHLNPQTFVDLVKKEFKKYPNVSIQVLDKQALTRKGMNLILAVGQGSNNKNSPRLLSITLKNSKGKKLALVGKGVCFDTGGQCLKPGNYQIGMQYDMSGAAIVVGTMLALAQSKTKANISVVCPLVINDIGSNSYKVSDVITSYSKKTVEITNTDAEGRLILADAITYAEKDLHADTILTIATLTGAVEVCFSDVYTPLWFTDEKQFKELKNAANTAAELVWMMPMHYEYTKRMTSSKIADCVNSEKTRGAGSSTAACFLSLFRNKAKFIHADIASTNEYKNTPLAIMLRTLFYFSKSFK